MVNRERMTAQLLLHEGLRLKPYRCSEGYLTIGVGYNIDARGWGPLESCLGRVINKAKPSITRAEALRVLEDDIDRYERELETRWPHYKHLDEVRQRVVLDMAFNMGFKLATFKNTKKAIEASDWQLAAAHMMKSLWSRQVGDGVGGTYDRAERLKDMMLTGKDYTA